MTVTLEIPDVVHAGEAIAGTVRAKGRVRIRVRRTSVWRGGASVADASLDHVTDGVVVIGDATFMLPPLRGPLTYLGDRVELRWSVIATTLDGPREEHALVPFTLVAPRTTTYERETAGGYRDPPTETTALEPSFGEQHVEGRRRVREMSDPVAMVVGWLTRTSMRLMSSRGVNDLTLDVTPSRLRAGEELVAKVAFTTKEEIVVESITVQLAEREHRYFRREREPLVASRVETITERARLSPGPHAYEARVCVPADAPASFATKNVAVEWFVRATIQVDGFADSVSEFVIGVAPF